jgi:hypothetical protein
LIQNYWGVLVGVGVGVPVGAAVVGVGVNVAVTTMTIGVFVGVGVGPETDPVGVFVGVMVTVPVVAAPFLITTVSPSPNVAPLSLDNFQVPVMVPVADVEVNSTETSTDSPGFTTFPIAVAFPPRLSPETKTSL